MAIKPKTIQIDHELYIDLLRDFQAVREDIVFLRKENDRLKREIEGCREREMKHLVDDIHGPHSLLKD